MPEIILNTAGFTRTTGTANPTITGDTGKSGSLNDVATGKEVAYVRRYSSNKPGFENCIGIWRKVAAAGSIGYIERTSVELSSNPGDDGYDPVVWGVGEQIIDVTITPDMIVADDDERLKTVAPGDLGTVATIAGTEKWVAVQPNGDGIDLTAQQVAGSPVTDVTSHSYTHHRGFSDFSKVPPTYTATDGQTFGLEPYEVNVSGTGASVLNGAFVTGDATVFYTHGTTNSGNCGLLAYTHQILFNPAKEFVTTWKVSNSPLPNLTDDATFNVGFTTAWPLLAVYGMYFELNGASANWFAVVKNPTATRVDTGVAAVNNVPMVLRVHYDPAALATKFYIDGDLVATILNSTRVLDTNQALQMAFASRKTAGTTGTAGTICNHSYDIPRSSVFTGVTLEHFS